jgi:hypothetical protein
VPLEAYLEAFLKPEKVSTILSYLEENNCSLRVTKPRITKRGDFRTDGVNHKISVNQDTNKYRFLLTFIHEIAHLKTFVDFGNKVNPHGKEWKANFRLLFSMWNLDEDFDHSEDLLAAILEEKNNPSACSGVDYKLEKLLQEHDDHDKVLLGEVPMGANFIFRGITYKKLEKRRTRCLCLSLSNNRKYTLNIAAMVDAC